MHELSSFSESIKQQFKRYDIAAEQAKPIEESVNDDEIKKKNINSKFIDMAKRVVEALAPRQSETRRIFSTLAPFSKITGTGVSEIVESLQTKGVAEAVSAPVTQPQSAVDVGEVKEPVEQLTLLLHRQPCN